MLWSNKLEVLDFVEPNSDYYQRTRTELELNFTSTKKKYFSSAVSFLIFNIFMGKNYEIIWDALCSSFQQVQQLVHVVHVYCLKTLDLFTKCSYIPCIRLNAHFSERCTCTKQGILVQSTLDIVDERKIRYLYWVFFRYSQLLSASEAHSASTFLDFQQKSFEFKLIQSIQIGSIDSNRFYRSK